MGIYQGAAFCSVLIQRFVLSFSMCVCARTYGWVCLHSNSTHELRYLYVLYSLTYGLTFSGFTEDNDDVKGNSINCFLFVCYTGQVVLDTPLPLNINKKCRVSIIKPVAVPLSERVHFVVKGSNLHSSARYRLAFFLLIYFIYAKLTCLISHNIL